MDSDSNPFDDIDGAKRVEPMQSLAVGAIAEAEISQQIATAQKFPKHTTVDQIRKVRERVLQLAKSSPEVASECFYRLKRKGRDESGQSVVKVITGPSIRFAEVVASVWGNCRVGARVIEEGQKFLVAQGVFHDLETNVAWNSEVRVRITGKFGRYNDDMIGTSANAACSKAARNALFKGVPKAYWNDLHEQVMQHAIGDAKTIAERRDKAVAHFKQMGVSEAELLRWLSTDERTVSTLKEIDGGMVAELKSLATAIKDGETTIDDEFRAPEPEPAPAKQEGAPTTSAVTDSEALGDKPTPPPEETKKRTSKKTTADEVEAGMEAEQKGADAVKEKAPARVALDPLPLTDETVVLFGFVSDRDIDEVDGMLRWTKGEPIAQRVDGKWQSWSDRPELNDFVKLYVRKRLTQHWKRSRLDRAAAFEQITELLKLKATPASLDELTMDQLVAALRGVEDDAQ